MIWEFETDGELRSLNPSDMMSKVAWHWQGKITIDLRALTSVKTDALSTSQITVHGSNRAFRIKADYAELVKEWKQACK